MRLATVPREPRLPVPLRIALALAGTARAVAGGARHTLFIFGRRHLLRRHRHPAGVADREASGLEAVGDADPGVEQETLALPKAFLRRYLLEIFEDAAFEVIDLLDP